MAIQNRITSHRSYYITRTKETIRLILENAHQKYASRYYQLKVRNGAEGSYLARLKIIETLKGWLSGVVEQAVEHLYIRYHK